MASQTAAVSLHLFSSTMSASCPPPHAVQLSRALWWNLLVFQEHHLAPYGTPVDKASTPWGLSGCLFTRYSTCGLWSVAAHSELFGQWEEEKKSHNKLWKLWGHLWLVSSFVACVGTWELHVDLQDHEPRQALQVGSALINCPKQTNAWLVWTERESLNCLRPSGNLNPCSVCFSIIVHSIASFKQKLCQNS